MTRAWTIFALMFLLSVGSSVKSGKGAAAMFPGSMLPAPQSAPGTVNVLTYHNDLSRTGQNLSETALTPASVTGGTFGLVFNTGLVGASSIRNQALVMTGVDVGGTVHDMVFVATPASYVYGLDAYNGQILWTHQVLPTAYGGNAAATDVFGGFTAGFISTPVIDPGSNLLYACTHVQENSGGTVYDTWWLVVLDLPSGNYRLGSPVLIASSIGDTYIGGPTPTVNGIGQGPANQPLGQVAMDASQLGQRTGLTLNGGSVYLAFSAPASVNPPFHGWVLGFDRTTLQPTAVFCTTPNDPQSSVNGGGGIWQAGGGLVVDGGGNMYFSTGNGLFDTTLDANGFPNMGDYGDCVLKIAPDPNSGPNNQNVNGWGLRVVDYFAPSNTVFLTANDYDLSSGAPILLPNGEILQAGKNSVVYLLNSNNMGKFDPNADHVIQEFPNLVNCGQGTPCYFNGAVYIIPTRNDNNPNSVYDAIKQFPVQGNGTLSTNPVVGPHVFGYSGCSCAISANGTSNGIVWAIDTGSGTSGVSSLRAYDATNVSSELLALQLPDTAIAWAAPTVANGMVYVPLQNGLAGYSTGTQGPPPPPPPGTIGDPGYENQTQAAGAPLILPWSGEGPAQSGVDDTNGVGGSHCGYIYDGGTGGWSAIVQTITVSPNTNYTLSCFVQTDGAFPAQGSMGVRDPGGSVIAQQSYGQMTNFTQLSVNFNSGGNSSLVIFCGFTDSGPGAWIHVDSWSLTSGGAPPPPPGSVGIRDPAYELQTQADGTALIPPWSSTGPATCGVDDSNGINGTHCGYIYDGGTGAWTAIVQTITVNPNTTYALSCYVQTDGSFPAQGQMGAYVGNGNTLGSQNYGQMNNYTQVSTTFNSGSNTSVVIYCGFTNSGGAAWIHVDNWILTAGASAPPPPGPVGAIQDPAYENQTQAAGTPLIAPWSSNGPATAGVDDSNGLNGTKCGYIYDGGTGAWTDIVQTITVSANTTYTLSCYVQTDDTFPAQGQMGAYVGNGTTLGSQNYGQMSNYTRLSATFNSGSNTSIVIYCGFTDSGGAAWIHVDSWSLTAGGSTPAGSPAAIQDPSYENQSQAAGSPLTAPWSGEGPATSGVDDTNGRNGTHCGYIYDGGTGGWSDIGQTISVIPNTNYQISCYIQTDSAFPAQGSVGVRTTGGTVIAQQGYGQMTNFTKLSVSFNSGSNSSVVIFAGFTDSGAGAWIHVDDWSISP
jgi:hypothetical protein